MDLLAGFQDFRTAAFHRGVPRCRVDVPVRRPGHHAGGADAPHGDAKPAFRRHRQQALAGGAGPDHQDLGAAPGRRLFQGRRARARPARRARGQAVPRRLLPGQRAAHLHSLPHRLRARRLPGRLSRPVGHPAAAAAGLRGLRRRCRLRPCLHGHSQHRARPLREGAAAALSARLSRLHGHDDHLRRRRHEPRGGGRARQRRTGRHPQMARHPACRS